MNVTWKLALFCIVLVTNCQPAKADVGTAKKDVTRYASLKVGIQSWIAGDAMATYRTHGSGSCSSGGTVGLGVSRKASFNVDVRCLPDGDRIVAEVSIRPYENNPNLKASKSVVDLSDMRPDFVEVTSCLLYTSPSPRD